MSDKLVHLKHLSEGKLEKIRAFNPNEIGRPNGNLYGLPFTAEESAVVVIPVPWEVTVSYRVGTALAPAAILAASYQLDLIDPFLEDAWQYGVSMLPFPKELYERNQIRRLHARECIRFLEKGRDPNESAIKIHWDRVNGACEEMNAWVKGEAEGLLASKKLVGVLGGDHSVALGLMQALAGLLAYGVLHIDAHFDLRNAYEGFHYSHASIMRNAYEIPEIVRFVHVGIRDYCPEEIAYTGNFGLRSSTFFNHQIRRETLGDRSWLEICERIVTQLPPYVYVSLDIDGLKPEYCPHTGTPVPGGLDIDEVYYLLEHLVRSGRVIIGFDLSEVAPASHDARRWKDDWDANVGMRVLYRLANVMIKSLENA